jgi:hypothetical protein
MPKIARAEQPETAARHWCCSLRRPEGDETFMCEPILPNDTFIVPVYRHVDSSDFVGCMLDAV